MDQRITCYFDLTANGSPLGRVEFELLNDVVPITVENFRVFCTGEKEGFTYKDCKIHDVRKDSYMQGGDFLNNDGTGNISIYGGLFDNENHYMKPSRPGVVCLANKGPNTNGSQFTIILEPKPSWNTRNVAFGRVKNGMDLIWHINETYGSNTGEPSADIRISDCGQL